MTLMAMLAATGLPRLLGGRDRGRGPGSSTEPVLDLAVQRREGNCRVLWDEVPPSQAGSWPASGTLLFLWPQLHGDRRLPAWSWRPGDPEDEYAGWWNREDRRLSAGLLQPFCSDLVAFLSERAGPARFEAVPRLAAVRRYLCRLDVFKQRRPASLTDRSTPLDALAALIEGADDGARGACTVVFGFADVATLHARPGERCLWLWLATGVREDFDRFREEAGGGFGFDHGPMDWFRTGHGLPAPRPPELTLR